MTTDLFFLITEEELSEIGRPDISMIVIGEIQDKVLSRTLSKIPICDLTDELARREAVQEIVIAPDEDFVAANCGRNHENILQEQSGPARILVVID